jgi:uncharacterized membrane protein YdjX (TVP38/TMEM64 family)
MRATFQKFWPFILGICLFVVVSTIVHRYLPFLTNILTEGPSKSYGMTAYVLLGMASVVIPFASLIPVIPVAVALWGWKTTALLTILAWVLGGQILFELARHLGKSWVKKLIPAAQLDTVHAMIRDKNIFHAILIRTVIHGDIVSYAFGILTDISRWEFMLVTALGVAPSAIIYSLYGSMPLHLQVYLGILCIVGIVAFWAGNNWRKSRRGTRA